MAIDDGVNGIFYLSLITLLCTSISLSIRYCYKSKCSEFSCCCMKLKRDVDIEKQEDFQFGVSEKIQN